jgi:hypothetical protein
VKKLNYKKKTCATRMKMYNVGTLDASRCQAQWATAEPLLRQAASSSPICKRGSMSRPPRAFWLVRADRLSKLKSKRNEAAEV